MSDIRPLTREEQLQWYIPFLEEQIEIYKQELKLAKEELKQVQSKQLVLQKKNTYNNIKGG